MTRPARNAALGTASRPRTPDARIVLGLLGLLLLAACSDTMDRILDPGKADCGRPYPDWATSDYVLPYPVGASYDLLTGNCDPAHSGPNRYGYDFMMSIGSTVTASRGGEIVFLEERWPDAGRDPSQNNGIIIAHDDGSFGFYFHLQQNSIPVRINTRVAQGEIIGRSGASGTGPEHLHFNVSLCNPGCGSEPTTYSNTDPNPGGLFRGHRWPALPY